MSTQPDRVPTRLPLWSLSEDVLVEIGPREGQLVVLTQWGEITVDDPGPLVRESLQRMSLGPVSVENLPVRRELDGWTSGQPEDAPARAAWDRFTEVLDQLGCCVVQSLGLDDESGPVLSVLPVSRRATFRRPRSVDLTRPVRLSRFAALRAQDGELLLESPLTWYRVVLHRPIAAWIVGSLGGPTTIAELSEQLNLAAPVVTDILSYLVASGMVLTAEPGADEGGYPVFAEDGDPELAAWPTGDLEFHARTRLGRTPGPPPATNGDTVSVTRPAPTGPRIELRRPLITEWETGGRGVVGSNGGDRAAGELHADQIGELLYRAARIRSTGLAAAISGPAPTAERSGAGPGGAALYELELYVSIDRCVGIPRGSYWYDPGEHALTLVNDAEADLDELLDLARHAADIDRRPPVLITLSTRIARVTLRYSALAYATTLKSVGTLQQTLHLVATAMGVPSRALTSGDGARADQLLRLDWPTEVSVGEFVLGA